MSIYTRNKILMNEKGKITSHFNYKKRKKITTHDAFLNLNEDTKKLLIDIKKICKENANQRAIILHYLYKIFPELNVVKSNNNNNDDNAIEKKKKELGLQNWISRCPIITVTNDDFHWIDDDKNNKK